MFCPHCGKDIGDAGEACPHCGYPLKLSSELGTSKTKKGKTKIVKTIPGATTVTTESHTFKVDHAQLGDILAACGIDKDADLTKLNADDIQRMVQYVQEHYKESGAVLQVEDNRQKTSPSQQVNTFDRETEPPTRSMSEETYSSQQERPSGKPIKLIALIVAGSLIITLGFFIYAFTRPHKKETTELPGYTQTQPGTQNPSQPNVNTPGSTTNQGVMMEVVANYLRLYTKPGRNSSEVTNQPTLFTRDKVQVLQQIGEWALVKTAQGNVGWVMLQDEGKPTLKPFTEPTDNVKTPSKH
jgi:hypothetical protein